MQTDKRRSASRSLKKSTRLERLRSTFADDASKRTAARQLSMFNTELGVTIGLAWSLSIDDCTDDHRGV